MLDKMFGIRLVSKLRAILLMEADFNAMNKEVCGVRMLEETRKYKLVLEEIFSEQNCTANDGGLVKPPAPQHCLPTSDPSRNRIC